jgi:hypothetical protein
VHPAAKGMMSVTLHDDFMRAFCQQGKPTGKTAGQEVIPFSNQS